MKSCKLLFIEGTICWTIKKKKPVIADVGTNSDKAWTQTSDIKLIFIRIFEVFGKLIHCCCEVDWQKFHLFQKCQSVLWDVHSICSITIIHMDTCHRIKGNPCMVRTVTYFKNENQYSSVVLCLKFYFGSHYRDCRRVWTEKPLHSM